LCIPIKRTLLLLLNLNNRIMETLVAIKPGPKPNKIDGTPDERRRVTPPNQPKHPPLKPHIHKPGDSKK
jgi:hypothetical protein